MLESGREWSDADLSTEVVHLDHVHCELFFPLDMGLGNAGANGLKVG